MSNFAFALLTVLAFSITLQAAVIYYDAQVGPCFEDGSGVCLTLRFK